MCLAAASLWAAAAAGGQPSVRMFPRSGPRDDKTGAADVALALPQGWSLDEIDTAEGRFALAKVPAKGRRCENHVWYDYVPAVTVEYTKRLIDTESLEVTSAIRRWSERQYSEIRLASRAAVLLRSPESDLAERSVYLLPARGGVLVIHAMARGDRALECVALHHELASTLVSAFHDPPVLKKAEKLSATRSPPALNRMEPVPRNLEECFEALEKASGEDELERFRSAPEGDIARYHFTTGMDLRNRWGLWQRSPLAKYFEAMGIFHPDDMSAIILTSFWRHLNAKPLQLEEQVATYRRHWDARRKPEPKRCEDGTAAVALFGLYGRREAPPRFVHVFACDANDKYWVYELDKGWYEPDASMRRRIAEVRQAPRILEAPLDADASGPVLQQLAP